MRERRSSLSESALYLKALGATGQDAALYFEAAGGRANAAAVGGSFVVCGYGLHRRDGEVRANDDGGPAGWQERDLLLNRLAVSSGSARAVCWWVLAARPLTCRPARFGPKSASARTAGVKPNGHLARVHGSGGDGDRPRVGEHQRCATQAPGELER